MRITCIVVDDEPLAVDKMKQYIDRIDYLDLVASFENAVESLNYLKTHKVDLVFLDIQMEGLTGIQLLESVKIESKVILTTAYDKYAIKGYELDVADYLLKPISFERFLKAIDKIQIAQITKVPVSRPSGSILKQEKGTEDYFFVKTEYRIEKINFNDILFIEGMKDYLRIWTESKKIMTLMSFHKLMEILPPDIFVRVHKSYVVSLPKIQSVQRNRINIADEQIPVGESYKQLFFDLLRKKMLLG
ncbi:MAG: response regulator transcription factor [Bacteroidales bacterium]|nr:response regulator transcription factor [Bacteroidales bacterium]